jgi:hypothetical protein
MLLVVLRPRLLVEKPRSPTVFCFCLAPLPRFHPPLSLGILLINVALVAVDLFEFRGHSK